MRAIELGVDPEYLLDKAQTYEIEILLEGASRRNVETWRQTRKIVHAIVQVNSQKQVDERAMMPLPCDNMAPKTTKNVDIKKLLTASKKAFE